MPCIMVIIQNHLVPKCLAVAKLETFKINLISGLNHSVINHYLITAMKMHHDHEVRSSACWVIKIDTQKRRKSTFSLIRTYLSLRSYSLKGLFSLFNER